MEVRIVVPSEEQVCKALSEWYGRNIEVKYNKDNATFYYEYSGGQFITNICSLDFENECFIRRYLPPHLIVMIGLFYQYGGKK